MRRPTACASPCQAAVIFAVTMLLATPGSGGAANRVTALECRTSAPRTVSPTKSRLWTVNHRGRYAATPTDVDADGSISLKAPWWAMGPPKKPRSGPRGRLVVSGRRVDGAAPPLRARATPTWQEGYRGSAMWAVVITFPAEGCWRVTGRVERTVHSFTLLVTR